ncbi:hypothetical protein EX30DRAFT_258449 [Ascodesmis nigricans]|uniref:Meiotic expression up-regulated protein 6 PH domain-containing protein n=1 Tax=Ascodesmis nigricans TaxID=341454 RepID=A0A4S2MHV3_9PEZI|nr:hypothetical protein EX30DRAFT_258449 [Ascodesmis nigricans]
MSDATATKPTEPVAADSPKVEETATAPATETTPAPAVEETTATAAAAEEETKPAEEPKKEEEKPEPKEITHGTLAKTHRGVLSFFKQKRYFYFQEDAVSDEKLKHHYLHKESASKPTAAHASQTGKGLWFYSKHESHKDAPHGIVKLADVTEVVPVGVNRFVLKLSGGELQFEAPPADRDNWVYTLNQKVEEAKAADKDIVESEGYKEALERFVKPVAAKPAEKAPETKIEEAAPAAEENKEEETKAEEPAAAPVATPEAAVTSDDEAGPAKKAKRGSVFEKFGGKFKSHKAAEKEPEAKEEAKEEEAKPAETTETAAAAPVDVEAPVAAETAEASDAVKPVEEKAEEEKPAAAASPKEKRKSSFFSFGKKKEEAAVTPTAEEKKDEVKPEVKEEPAAAEEPAAPAAEEVKPVETATEADATKATETPADEAEEKKEEKAAPASPKSHSKSFFSGFLAKREKSPGPKAAIEPTAEAKAETSAAEVKDEAPATTSETVPENAVESPAAVEETSEATTSPKEKRKSFFAFKKPSKSEDVKSDSEEGEPKEKPAKTNYVQGLIRKVSQRAQSGKAPEKEVATPAPVAEEAEPSAAPQIEEPVAAPAKEEEEVAVPAAAEEKPAQSIGDVVPEAVNVGKPAQVSA